VFRAAFDVEHVRRHESFGLSVESFLGIRVGICVAGGRFVFIGMLVFGLLVVEFDFETAGGFAGVLIFLVVIFFGVVLVNVCRTGSGVMLVFVSVVLVAVRLKSATLFLGFGDVFGESCCFVFAQVMFFGVLRGRSVRLFVVLRLLTR
jgi:hypothetical protein